MLQYTFQQAINHAILPYVTHNKPILCLSCEWPPPQKPGKQHFTKNIILQFNLDDDSL